VSAFTVALARTLGITASKMARDHNPHPYGPVVVTKGEHKGRIGYLDDDTWERGRTYGIVYFASFGLSADYYLIPPSSLALPDPTQLLDRMNALWELLSAYRDDPLEGEDRIEALQELNLVEGILAERMFAARLTKSEMGAKIFLSHSSVDKTFITKLAVDLRHLGHDIWLDEWDILVGDSIPRKIAAGLSECVFVAVALSKASVASHWVENEWHSKYWDEVNSKMISVLPILIDDCEVPVLLKTKKYVDFRRGYTPALEALGHSLARHMAARKR
jgi:hypothetical protein